MRTIFKLLSAFLLTFVATFSAHAEESENTSRSLFGSLVDIADNMLYQFSLNAPMAFTLGLVVLAAMVGLIILIRRHDPKYKLHYLYYILYIIAIIPTLTVTCTPRNYWANRELTGVLMSLLMTFIPCIMAIFAGWGVRMNGMTEDIRRKNRNFNIGNTMLFVAWMCIIATFVSFVSISIVDWCYSPLSIFLDGHFTIILVVTIISAGVTYCLLRFLWLKYIVKYLLKTASNSVISIMTYVIGGTIAVIVHNWNYEHCDGLLFIVAFILIWGSMLFVVFSVTSKIEEVRCRMCHSEAKQTNYINEGYGSSTSEHWEDIDSSDVRPSSYGATVIGAERRVSTTSVYKKWATEHTCTHCGYVWKVKHSKLLHTIHKTIEKHWYESD